MWSNLESRFGFGFSESPTENFEQDYTCFSVSCAGREDLEHGNKILLPQSALNCLSRINVTWPMFFKISNKAHNLDTHCGVMEFSSEEGICFIPYWVMQNLCIDEGEIVNVNNVFLPKGTFVKLQPISKDFLLIEDPKTTLETALGRFASVTVGDIISIQHNNTIYKIDIIECSPASAISLIETDVEVDFAPPKDYVEPPRTFPSIPQDSVESHESCQTSLQTESSQIMKPLQGGVRIHCEHYEELLRHGKVQGKLKNIDVYLPQTPKSLFSGKGYSLS